MLLRNVVELLILLAVCLAGIVVYVTVRSAAADYESDLVVRKKNEIQERIRK